MDRMPPVPDSSARPANQTAANDYDSFAEAYTAETEANLVNGYYERPAILDPGTWTAAGPAWTWIWCRQASSA